MKLLKRANSENIFRFVRKLRFLDYLIILIAILAIVLLYKFFNPEEKWTKVVVLSQNVPSFQANALKIGDTETDPSGKKIAEIADINIFDIPSTPVSDKYVFLTINILTKVNSRSKELEYKNRIIKIGSKLEFSFNQGKIDGIISDLGEEIQKEVSETKVLTLKLYDEWPWFADSLKIGEGETDETGKKIIEIIDKEVQPAEMTVVTQNGETLLRTNPRKVDITLKVKVKIRKVKNELIFRKNTTILIGKYFSFTIGNTRVKDAPIINIE